MIKKLLSLIFLSVLSTALIAQVNTSSTEKKKGRPNIPGTFAIDLGFNFPSEKENFHTNAFGSRTLNISYFYDYQIGKSKFSAHAGIGLGLERYKFNNDRTLRYVPGTDSISMFPIAFSKVKKSGLITNYIDIPVELRFSSNPNDPGRSFNVSLGFKVGMLYDSFTKIKYSQDGETKKLKDKQNFNINPFRYGVTLKAGVGSFSVFGYYSLTPIFKDKQGPSDAEITNITFGLSFAAF